MASKAREGCQPVRQTSSLPGPPTDGSVGHVSRGEQKAQTASQQSPGTASACEGLIEQGSCDRAPRNNNGVEAGRGFSCMPGGDDNRHLVLRCTTTQFSNVVLIYLFYLVALFDQLQTSYKKYTNVAGLTFSFTVRNKNNTSSLLY